MKHLYALVIVFCAGPLALAGGSLAEARKALLGGNYAEAREIYEEHLNNAKSKPAAAIGVSRAYQAQGEYDLALKVVDAALKDLSKNVDLLARRAEILYARGRLDEADKAAKQAIDLDEKHFLARWIAGQVLRDRGELDKADEEFRWFIRAFNDMDITDPQDLLIVGLAACERARYHNLADQFEFVLDDVWAEIEKSDKLFWPAAYEAGRLFQEKYNKAAAHRAFERALKVNPRAAEVLTSKGIVSLQRFETKDADMYAEQALKINPRLPEALRLRADLHLFAGDLKAALADLDKAREVNPRDESTLGRLAGVFFIQKRQADLKALVQEVEKNNSRPAIFYTELAEQLDQRKLYKEAEGHFKRAMELQPKLPWPQNGLGMLYMRMGKEEEARKVLEKAFDIDSFNVQVSNSLKVLDHLDKYATLKTKHFHVRYDPKNDKVLAQFMGKYLEDIYDELAQKFDYRPDGPFLIEVFNKHEMFSGRVVALPDLHTIGACTGRLVAMVSPRDKSKVISKPFNWNRVLRHELVHVFNLEQTGFQIPHWFTEGLAVRLEGSTPPPTWTYLLAEKLQADDLLNLDTILLGFIRPRSPDQWQQAYAQSLYYVEYLVKTYEEKAIGMLLAAYSAGMETDQALQKSFNVTKAEFEKGYRAYLEEKVKGGPKAAAKKFLTTKALKEAFDKNPEDPDLAAQLADRYYATGNKKEARKLADQALKAKMNQPLAAYVKARLLRDAGDDDIAIEILEAAAAEEDCNEVKTLRLLGNMQFENKKFTQAAKTFERCRKLDPNDASWLGQLAKIYIQSGDNDKLMDVLKDATEMDPDDLTIRKKLCVMMKEKGNHALAEKYAKQGLEIDVLNKECQEVFLAALAAQNKDEELKIYRKLLEE